jgi:hypothetical protein
MSKKIISSDEVISGRCYGTSNMQRVLTLKSKRLHKMGDREDILGFGNVNLG